MTSPSGATTPVNEKEPLESNEQQGGLFAKFKRKPAATNEKEKTGSDDENSSADHVAVDAPKPVEPELTPVPFLKMFRFATKFELVLDAIGLFMGVVAGAGQPLMTLLFGNLTLHFVNFTTALNQGVAQSNPQEFAQLRDDFKRIASKDALFLVYIGIGMLVATYIYQVSWTYTGEVMAKRIRENYLKAILRQDIAYFDTVGAGEVATRIQTDCHLVQQGTSEKVAMVANYLSAFITGFVIAYIRSWKLALALTSILPCIAMTSAVMNIFISKYMQASLKHTAEGGTLAEEVIATVRTTQAFGSQRKLSDLYDDHVAGARTVDVKAAIFHGAGLACFFFVIYAAYGLTFYFGTTLLLSGDVNSGIIVNVFLAILIGSFSLALLAPEMQAISHGRGAAAKLYATMDRVPDIDSASPEGMKPKGIAGDITFENVSFNYPSRPTVPIVKNLSIKFPAGRTAALVGASGSGKSTVVALVERFYDPLSGIVRLDGIDIRELNVKWLRSQIGLVSQEPTLFATTIRGNVEHGLIGTPQENASDEEKFALVKEACTKANADGFISNLPDGYDTMVGERGFLLSGGQKQRVSIARAIVSDPKLLLLDEATSALDTQSEGVVQNALDKAAAGRTTITIAHRLSTIKDANRIYVMGDGEILEQGTHNELLADENGPYSRLVRTQQLREAKEKDEASDDTTPGSGASPADSAEEIEKAAKREIPLGHKKSGMSLASEIIEERRKAGLDSDRKFDGPEHGLYDLFKRAAQINKDARSRYGFGTIAACATGCVYPAFGIVYALAIQSFSLTDRGAIRHAGNRNALWFFIIAILSSFSIGCQNYLFASAASILTNRLRSLSFKAILRQDIEFFDQDKNSTGALTASLSDNPQKVNGLAGITLGAIVQSIACLIAASVIGLSYGWKLALVGIACMPVLVSAGYIRLRIVVLKDQINKKSHESSAQLACEAAASIRTVASLTREGDCCRLYSKSLEAPLKQSNRTSLYSNLLFAASQSASMYVIALVFWYGSRLVASTEYSIMQFFVCLMSTTFGAIQAGNVFSFVPDMSSARGAGSDIINLLDSRPTIDAESTEGLMLKEASGHLKIEDVHFRYPTRPGVRVLRNMNLAVKPGTYIALVGASGCGKSTVIQLVERFYDPLAGNVYLDGHNIAEMNVSDYRKHIALVSQEPTLYAGTVRFNILLGATRPQEEITQEEIEDACRDANILEFIRGLPDGFDTEVGGKGSQLSGGQKQRIAIARALIRNPKILLLDEATSALDSNSEKVVQDALDKAAKGRTTIAIAHRLSTIQNADCIYFIKEGSVSEAGTHEQLLAKRGDYYEYVQLQALSKK